MSNVSYRSLAVWQRAMDLIVIVYTLTSGFPSTERYGIISQMRRAALSIPSNIAEGSRRKGRKEFRQFVLIAYGSGAELETFLEIVRRLKLGNAGLLQEIDVLLGRVMQMLNRLENALR